MKKSVLLTLMVFFWLPSMANCKIRIEFLNGDIVTYEAQSCWTEYNKHNKCYEFYERDKYGIASFDYECVSDYVEMNPVSRETKKDDFRHVRDKVQALGHDCHYFDKQDILADQYGISLRYSEIKFIEINGRA